MYMLILYHQEVPLRFFFISYSRRVMWLEVGTTNNDPSVVTYYFLKCVKNLNGKLGKRPKHI